MADVMPKRLMGPKALAEALEIDVRTARTLLLSIADTEPLPGVLRLTPEGFESWLRDKMNARAGQKEKPNQNAQISKRPESMGGAENDRHRPWTFAEELLREDGGGGGGQSRPRRRRTG